MEATSLFSVDIQWLLTGVGSSVVALLGALFLIFRSLWRLESSLASLNTRMYHLEARMDRLETRMDTFEQSMKDMRRENQEFRDSVNNSINSLVERLPRMMRDIMEVGALAVQELPDGYDAEQDDSHANETKHGEDNDNDGNNGENRS